jgi:hypothetical protein
VEGKYDARKTLKRFLAQLHDETDPDALGDDLVGGKGDDAASPRLALVAPSRRLRRVSGQSSRLIHPTS